MKLHKIGALAAVSVLALAACNSGGTASTAPGGSAAAGGTPAACANKKGTSSTEIHVYSSLPRQGSNTEQTNTLVEQIKQTLDGQKIGNFTIKYTDLDDSSAANNGDWDGAVEQQNANKAAADPDAMVYIGTYNSGAAKLSIPILNAACLVMISPANTYPGLTKAVEGVTQPGEPDSYYPGGYRNYARVVSTDDVQGAAGAEWAKSQGTKKAYVLDDTQVYGAGLAKSWALHANKIGIEVVSPNKTSEGFDAKATDYSALAQKIKATGADTIYIGSITGQNTGKLWKDLRAALPDITIMSGDGVFEESWYKGAGTCRQRHLAHLRRRRSGAADRCGQGLVRQVQDRPRGQGPGHLHLVRQCLRERRPGGAPEGCAPTIAMKSSRTSWRPRTCRPCLGPRASTPTATPSVARSVASRSRPAGRLPSS